MATYTSGLDAGSTDKACNAPAKYTYYYYQPTGTSTASCTTMSGGNLATSNTTAQAGRSMPRLPTSPTTAARRGRYFFGWKKASSTGGLPGPAFYFDAAQPWQPWSPQKGWNGKLLWRFGGGSGGSQFQGGSKWGLFSTQTSFGVDGIFQRDALARGYMFATAQLTNNADNVNHILAAEQMMMLKEHIIDTYGEIRFAVREGVRYE